MKKVLVKEREKEKETERRKRDRKKERTISNHLRMSMWFPIESNARKTNADILRIQLQFSCVSHLLHKWTNASHTLTMLKPHCWYAICTGISVTFMRTSLSVRQIFHSELRLLCFVLKMDKLQLCSLASKGRGRTVNPGEKKREPKIMNQTNQRMIWTFMRKHFLSKRGEKKLWEQKKLKTLTRISHSVSSMLIFNRNSPAFWWTFFLFLLWEFNSF